MVSPLILKNFKTKTNCVVLLAISRHLVKDKGTENPDLSRAHARNKGHTINSCPLWLE